jgi:hypothetical protein
MKLKYLRHGFINSSRIINRFGNAWLIQLADRKFKLVGGSDDDYTAAKEWASLFAHEIVFSRPVKHWRQARFCFDAPLGRSVPTDGFQQLGF